MKSMFKSILALAMLTLFANINWAMGQTVNMNRWIELESDSVERVITFKFAADSPNTKARLLCGTLDTTFSIGTYLYYFSFYVPSHTVTIYGDITKFDCSSRYLTELDISNNTGLTTLYCHSNSFISLNFSGQTALEELDCSINQSLTSLNLSGCTALKTIESDFNPFLITMNLSGCTALESLHCNYNYSLSSLDVSGLTALKKVWCHECCLTTLNLSGCTALIELQCGYNNLTSLDLSDCPALERMSCYDNNISSLNLTGCSNLIVLNCEKNDLSSLDLSSCTNLNNLHCPGNNLSILNLSYCPLLHTFNCSENNLSSIKIWGCENLTYIECQDNKLSACGLDSLFYLLPKKTDGNTYKIIVNKNPGTRFCCDTLATNRGWLVVTDYYTLVVNSEYDCPDFIHEEEEFAIKVYPNPVREDLHIECSDKIESVKIYDALGRKIISKENTPNNTSIDFSNLGSGFYILKLRAAEGTEEFKVIKQ